jgi:uncharacterized protein
MNRAVTGLDALRAEYVDRLDEAVASLPDRLSRIPWVLKAVLFGSYAGGRRDLLTDLDLILVVRSDLPFGERLAEVRRLLPLGVDADVLAYTPEELESMRDRPFLRRALAEGSVIYEKTPD